MQKAPDSKPDEERNALSTSALAKRLRLPIQQLFGTLRDYGWIERLNDQWALTSKGTLHGGSYRDSDRFGRYIVWPEDLISHPMIESIESDQRLSTGSLSKHFHHLSPMQINRHLAELGFLQENIGADIAVLHRQCEDLGGLYIVKGAARRELQQERFGHAAAGAGCEKKAKRARPRVRGHCCPNSLARTMPIVEKASSVPPSPASKRHIS